MNSMPERIQKFNSDLKMYSPRGRVFSYLDLLVSALLFGASFDDYIRYRFWEKSLYSRNLFITFIRSKRTIKKWNNAAFVHLLNEKNEFNKFFSAFINRDWLLINDVNFDSFCRFVNTHSSFIFKPVNSGQGKGVEKVTHLEDKRSFFLSHNGFLVEEVIQQHSEMEKLNPSSVNSIRFLTLNNGTTVHIIAASLKTGGADGCTDNLHSGGVCASIDIESGVVYTKGINYQYQYFINHPISGVRIIGFSIPNWETAKNAVIKCAKMIPEVGYVGWDVAITNEGCSVIEGNHDPGHDVIQMIDQVGKYKSLKRV